MANEHKPSALGYSYLGLPEYMPGVAKKAIAAPTSCVLDTGEEIRPTHISHLAIATENFEAVANWWQEVLNAKPSLAASSMRFMTFDNEHHKVVIFETKGIKTKSGPGVEFSGLHHIAFSFAGFRELACTYLRLKEKGIVPWRGINHGSSFALDYHDPDFNTCELQCSCFPGHEEEKPPLNEWLATGAFNRNPIGVLFDMEEAIKAYEAGCDVQDIVSPYVMKVGEHTDAELAELRMAPVVLTPKK